jgi:hypothetical protein
MSVGLRHHWPAFLSDDLFEDAFDNRARLRLVTDTELMFDSHFEQGYFKRSSAALVEILFDPTVEIVFDPSNVSVEDAFCDVGRDVRHADEPSGSSVILSL